jgi:ABC-2 type transport system permease protein
MIADTLLVFRRSLARSLRAPQWVLIGLSQPLLYLALFGPLLRRVVASSADFPPGDSWQVFVPGLLVQLALFGSAFAGFDLVFEKQSGVLERMRVTPVSRAALLAGRVLKDVVMLAAQSVVLVGVAVLAGLDLSVGGAVAGLGVVLLLGGAMAAVSYTIALGTPTPDVLASVLNTAAVPLLLLSGVLLPMSLAPRWLELASGANPLRWVVDAERSVFRGDVLTGDVLVGAGVAAACLVLAGALGTRAFRRAAA